MEADQEDAFFQSFHSLPVNNEHVKDCQKKERLSRNQKKKVSAEQDRIEEEARASRTRSRERPEHGASTFRVNEHPEINVRVRPCPFRDEPMSSQMKDWWAEQFLQLAKKNVS